MLRLVSFGVCRETMALLRHLLELTTAGEVRGLTVCYWRKGSGYEVALTGVFSTEPTRALAGADLIKVSAALQLDLFA